MSDITAKSNAKSGLTVSQIAVIGVMTAATCVLAPLSLPIGPVPISLTNLVIYFSLYTLGTMKGTISYLVYLLLGLVGLPVFSGFTSGPGKLFGPTGGYLIGLLDHLPEKNEIIITDDDVLLRVEQMDKNRIEKIYIKKPEPKEEA